MHISKLGLPVDFSVDPAVARQSSQGFYATKLKRPLDLFLVLLMLPVALPLILLMALVVMLDGGKPFYSQLRVGRDGRNYRMWKLRSMVPNADAALQKLLAEDPRRQAEWDLMQKLEDDPRVTVIGRFLRKSSLDELPQLANVLMGDMSLVGPRPMLPEQSSIYPCVSYYRMRPGITGPWQVSERNLSTFSERARFDRDYLSLISFRTDVSLLLATVRVVLRGTGQ